MNDFSTMYCEMAMQHYALAKECFIKIEESTYDIDLYPVEGEMFKNCIATSVFAAMSIEAFFNNYAASCLGDDEFYKNFDSLSLLSKFQLISKFILRAPIDKGESYYYYLVALNRIRNDFAHNKSTTPKIDFLSEEEIKSLHDNWSSEYFFMKEPTLDKTMIKADFSNVQNAIKAIREIAYFFDRNDDNIQAVNRLFHILTIERAPNMISQYIKDTVKDFNIKAVNS